VRTAATHHPHHLHQSRQAAQKEARRGQPEEGTAMSENQTPQPRTVAEEHKSTGNLDITSLILVAILLAAGAVLKLTLGTVLTFAGMKPNFIIAMYCLAIILVRPKVPQAVIIGFIAGLVCQIPMLNATPWINLASETLGGLVCGLLILVPMKIADKVDVNPFVTTFLSTVVSGYTFAIIVGAVINGLSLPAVLATYALMVFGTALFNSILVQILVIPLRKVLKK
jgi:hypothetical protein